MSSWLVKKVKRVCALYFSPLPKIDKCEPFCTFLCANFGPVLNVLLYE